MKALKLSFFAGLLGVILSGCTTDRGGTYDDEITGASNPSYGVSGQSVPDEPWPAASPTFRPGLNPTDIRDPSSMTRPGMNP
jgi:hypothetical protein